MTNSPGRDPDVLHTKEQAEVLGVSDKLVRKMVQRGEIPGMRVGRLWLFSARAVEEAIRAKIGAAPLSPEPTTGDEVIGSQELATRIGIDVKYVRRAYHRGEIPGGTVGKDLKFSWQTFRNRLREFQQHEGTPADDNHAPAKPGRPPGAAQRRQAVAANLGITPQSAPGGEPKPR